LQQEYSICGVVVVFMAVSISILISLYSAFAFVLGAVTSIACGYFGMAIATYSNCRTTMACAKNLEAGFKTALRAGSVIGFTIVSVSLAVMVLLIGLFYLLQGCYYDYYEADRKSCLKFLFESVAGFGLGGSTVALFGRVGGGIYTKAADVGADLVGKV
jgi:H+-translocating diphosphatase